MRTFAGTPLIEIVVNIGGGLVFGWSTFWIAIVGTTTFGEASLSFGVFAKTSRDERPSFLLFPALRRGGRVSWIRIELFSIELDSALWGQSLATCPFSLQVKHIPSFLIWFHVGSLSFFFMDLFVCFVFAGFSFGFEDCFDFRGSDEGSGAYGPTFLSFISLSMISAFRLYSLNGKSRNNTIAFLISSCNPCLKLLSIKSEWI